MEKDIIQLKQKIRSIDKMYAIGPHQDLLLICKYENEKEIMNNTYGTHIIVEKK